MLPGINIDLAGAVEKLIALYKINQWVREYLNLYTSLIASYIGGGSFACGAALVAHQSVPVAVGLGMMSAVACAGVAWHNSSLTRGMTLVLPAEAAKKEIEGNYSISH